MGKEKKKRLWFHLAVLPSQKTGLFHGAIYRNHPSPSDCDRFFLDKTTKEGFMSPRRAAEEINAFVERESLEIELLDPKEFEDIPPIPNVLLSANTTFTFVDPRDKKKEAYVELWLYGELISGIEILPEHLDYLLARNIIEFDSGNCDPELSAVYEHYIFTEEDVSRVTEEAIQ